jgi:hypothetical protein
LCSLSPINIFENTFSGSKKDPGISGHSLEKVGI